MIQQRAESLLREFIREPGADADALRACRETATRISAKEYGAQPDAPITWLLAGVLFGMGKGADYSIFLNGAEQ